MKYTRFVQNSNSVKLYLDNGSRILIDDEDAVKELSKYSLADLIGQEYQPVMTVSELIKKHKLSARVSQLKIVSFKLGK